MSSYKGNRVAYGLTRLAFFLLFKVMFNFRHFGTERVPKDTDKRGVILAGNHTSYADPPIMAISLHRRVTYLAKEYLFKNFFVGPVLRGVGCFSIKSDKEDFRSVRELVRLLKDGKCVVVFPEGTRSQTGQFKEPESGIGFLAAKSGAYVVPIYIQGTYEVYPKGAKTCKRLPVRAYFGTPFIPAQDKSLMEAQDPYGAISRETMARIAKIKAEVEAGSFK